MIPSSQTVGVGSLAVGGTIYSMCRRVLLGQAATLLDPFGTYIYIYILLYIEEKWASCSSWLAASLIKVS